MSAGAVIVRPPTRWLIIGAVALIALGVACAVWMLANLEHKFDLIDLAVYRAAGSATLHGRSVYGPWVGRHLSFPLPFIYPPVAAAMAAPLAIVPLWVANCAWTIATVAVLAAVVRRCFAPTIDRFGRAAPLAVALTVGVALSLSPVEDHLRFGQVGVFLMAACVFDCTTPDPRWPRGVLVGVAAAIKLVPAIFIPYLWLTGRGRAAFVSLGTFLALSGVGWVIHPSDSGTFWRTRVFGPGPNHVFFSNQSLEGIIRRAIGSPWHSQVFLAAAVAVAVFGLARASAASLGGNEVLGVALTGLTGALISPISWIHHLVWIIPAIAVILGPGTDKRRVAGAFVVAALFTLRLPYVGNDMSPGGWVRATLIDSYGILCLVLVVLLSTMVAGPLRSRARARPAVTPSPYLQGISRAISPSGSSTSSM